MADPDRRGEPSPAGRRRTAAVAAALAIAVLAGAWYLYGVANPTTVTTTETVVGANAGEAAGDRAGGGPVRR